MQITPTNIGLFILVILVIVVLIANIRIVQQNNVFVIEFLGKFRRIMGAGLNFKVPFLERVAAKVTLRQQNFAYSRQLSLQGQGHCRCRHEPHFRGGLRPGRH